MENAKLPIIALVRLGGKVPIVTFASPCPDVNTEIVPLEWSAAVLKAGTVDIVIFVSFLSAIGNVPKITQPFMSLLF